MYENDENWVLLLSLFVKKFSFVFIVVDGSFRVSLF